MLFGNNSNGFTIGYGGTTDRFRFIDGGGVERLTILNGGKVGIGATSPAGHLEVAGSTDYSQIHLTDTDSNNTVQRLGIQGQHYGNSEAPIRIIGMYNSDTTSNVQIGGGSGDHNSATKIQFFTSANTTTSAGTFLLMTFSAANLVNSSAVT